MAQDVVRIVEVRESVDMRQIWALFDDPKVNALKPGQAILCFNGRSTMFRLIDSAYGIHTYYAEEGQRFTIADVQALMRSGLFVRLEAPAGSRVAAAGPIRLAA